MPPLRIYIDTSVVGGVFDDGFEEESRRIIDLARDGRIILLISDIVLRELRGAPDSVRDVLIDLPNSSKELVADHPEADELGQAYMNEKVVPDKFRDDAAHVATATFYRADAIVSWNFKHLVNTNRILQFNAVNRAMGHREVRIVAPPALEC